MTHIIHTEYYYYIYDRDKEDMIWYSPSSDDRRKCNRNLLNCIKEATRLVRMNPTANLDVYGHYSEMEGEYEYGDEGSFPVCTKEEFDEVAKKLKEELK